MFNTSSIFFCTGFNAVDKILQDSVDEIDGNIKVVNREYSNMEYQREKLSRKKAKLYDFQQESPLDNEAINSSISSRPRFVADDV